MRMTLSICSAMCLLGRTAIDKAISVKADSLYLLRQAPSQPVKSPNIVSKRSSRSNRWKPILVEAGLPGQIGSVLSTRAVRGKYRLRTQEGQKGQKAASSASVTDVHRLWVSLHRFGISDFRFGISDFEVWISESGFQCLAVNHCHKLANFCLWVKGDFGGAGGLAEG